MAAIVGRDELVQGCDIAALPDTDDLAADFDIRWCPRLSGTNRLGVLCTDRNKEHGYNGRKTGIDSHFDISLLPNAPAQSRRAHALVTSIPHLPPAVVWSGSS